MSTKKTPPKKKLEKKLTGTEIIKELKKYGYQGKSDYEIKKIIGGDKVATVGQLQKELTKLKKGSKEKKIKVRKSGSIKKRRSPESSEPRKREKTAEKSRSKGIKPKKVRKQLEKGTLIAAALMTASKTRGENCTHSKAVLVWNKKDWIEDKSKPTVAIMGTNNKKIDSTLRDYLILNRELDPELSDNDFLQVLEMIKSFAECSFSPRLNSIYEIRCIKAFNTSPQTFPPIKKREKVEVPKGLYTSKQIREFVLEAGRKPKATLPPYLRKRGQLQEQEFKPRPLRTTKSLSWAVPGKKLEKKYKPVERKEEKFIEPELTSEDDTESEDDDFYARPLIF